MIKQDKRPINIILLGDPAAGKATQAALLTKKYHLYDFDMGKAIALLRTKNKKINRLLRDYQDKGKLTPTFIARKILRDVITSVPMRRGILFDGHPKMLGEAKIVARLIKQQKRKDPVVIYLSIPIDETVKRMQDRVGYFKGKYGKRLDDSDAALKNRVRYYRKNITQVVAFFQRLYSFKKISGLGTPKLVHARILKTITQLKKSEKLRKN